ncbi:hypothetical protein FRC02_005123 [Tulasnella sp. 418]|nr:hypothetical protein FRC02_005123 [Tulasnella sp. 418]
MQPHLLATIPHPSPRVRFNAPDDENRPPEDTFEIPEGTPLSPDIEQLLLAEGYDIPEYVVAGRPRYWQKHYRYRVEEPPCDIQLSPLLSTSSLESTATTLEWNMLLHPREATLTRTHETASNYLHSPATQPPVAELTLVIPDPINGAYTTTLQNRKGISVSDVLSHLFNVLMSVVHEHEPQWTNLDTTDRKRVSRAYHMNRSIGNQLIGVGLRRIDFLGDKVIFGGLHRDFREAGLVRRSLFRRKVEPSAEIFIVNLRSVKHSRDSWYSSLCS